MIISLALFTRTQFDITAHPDSCECKTIHCKAPHRHQCRSNKRETSQCVFALRWVYNPILRGVLGWKLAGGRDIEPRGGGYAVLAKARRDFHARRNDDRQRGNPGFDQCGCPVPQQEIYSNPQSSTCHFTNTTHWCHTSTIYGGGWMLVRHSANTSYW